MVGVKRVKILALTSLSDAPNWRKDNTMSPVDQWRIFRPYKALNDLTDAEGEALEPRQLSTIEALRAMGRVVIEKPESAQLSWDW